MLHSNTYVLGIRPLEIIYSFSVGIDLRRQNLTSIVYAGPHVKSKIIIGARVVVMPNACPAWGAGSTPVLVGRLSPVNIPYYEEIRVQGLRSPDPKFRILSLGDNGI